MGTIYPTARKRYSSLHIVGAKFERFVPRVLAQRGYPARWKRRFPVMRETALNGNLARRKSVTVGVIMLAVLAFMVTAWAASAHPPVGETWPGGASVVPADDTGTFGGNLSGVDYEPSGTAAPGVLWAVRNGPENLSRLIWD